ncbi:hypothetical protein M426DRAFT_220774 [Hypoxylon sp. CI-4A]|nr:hypothetical protein M426DRAFT_220774 [Hypoxylon sp. CI-4A]
MGSGVYSVPEAARGIFVDGILGNSLMKAALPDLRELSRHVRFEGSPKPSIPINWRFAESVSALKAFEATMLNHLITRKYKVEPVDFTINTDHASLFFMTPMIARIVKDGKPVPLDVLSNETFFKNQDLHRSHATLYRSLATNIYKTKDGRYYHIHGSMNPDPTLTALGLPLEGEPDDTYDSVVERIQAAVSQFDAGTLDQLMNEQYRQAGTIAYTSDEFLATEHGRECSQIGLYEVQKDTNSTQPASWWPENESNPSSLKRPLAGLKVVDLSRVIAGPTISRSLAEMGASVMRVMSYGDWHQEIIGQPIRP